MLLRGGDAQAFGSFGRSSARSPTAVTDTDEWGFYIDCTPTATLQDDRGRGVYYYTRYHPEDSVSDCAALLTTENLNRQVAIWDFVLLEPKARTGSARFRGETREDETRLAQRCGVKACQTCCYKPDPTKCVFKIWQPNQNIIVWLGRCNICPQIDCPSICPNGQYAEEYKVVGSVGSDSLLLRLKEAVCAYPLARR